jgi:hypothetical protein
VQKTSVKSSSSLKELEAHKTGKEFLRLASVIFMKVGPHSGDALDTIIQMKFDEERKIGKFYWGYSGSLCHPIIVRGFIEESKKSNRSVSLLFSQTASKYHPPHFRKVREYSEDSQTWHELPAGVHLWNCQYAIVGKELKELTASIRLADYVVGTGNFRGRPMSRYIRGRVSKACAFLGTTPRHRKVRSGDTGIQYHARVVSPYCVYVR